MLLTYQPYISVMLLTYQPYISVMLLTYQPYISIHVLCSKVKSVFCNSYLS